MYQQFSIYTLSIMERPLNPKVKRESHLQGGCPLEQYFCCSSIDSRTSPMTGHLRASTMASQVGVSLVVNHLLMTSLSWSPGSLYWTLMESKLPTSNRSWMPRSYHLVRHKKISLKMLARSAMPKDEPKTVDVRKK